jgi:hypothetical protein
MLKHLMLSLSLALMALLGFIATEARAVPISMTVALGGGATFLVDAVATSTATTYNVDAGALAAMNAFLAANGSEYQLISLGGSSNSPGNTAQGNLVLTGEIHSVVGGGSDAVLKITESETNFTAPGGSSGALRSSSTGNFTNQAAGGGHTVSSAFNAISTPTYSILSSGIPVSGAFGSASVGVTPVTLPYTLTNVINFGLSPAVAPNDIVDSFAVTATITAGGIPEPASLVMMLTGIPLAVFGLLRRRRAAARR